MEDFLNKLYSYEYFGTYLMISIAILVLLFIIILFFGKKDQKHREIEATKKLQQINEENTFKEDSVQSKVEVSSKSVADQEKLENDTIIVPNINEIPVINNPEENNISTVEPVSTIEPISNVEPVNNDVPVVDNVVDNLEVNNDFAKEEFVSPVINENIDTLPEEKINTEPVLEKVEEKPLVLNDLEEPTVIVPKIEDFNSSLNDVEENKELKFEEPINEPSFNEEITSEIKPTFESKPLKNGPEIFSSVFVPEKENLNVNEKELEMEAPEVPSSEELDFELPTLKKDFENSKDLESKEIEKPVLNDYNLDNLAGETYMLNDRNDIK